jgi:predicted AAA+ superfamily ATPase
MKADLIKIVDILNPWLKDPSCWASEIAKKVPGNYVQRSFFESQSKKWENKKKVHLIVGARQAGKSTVIWKHLAKKNGRVLYLNCEEALIREWCLSPSLFYDDIKGYLNQIDVIFLEEAQHLKEAGLFLKGLSDFKLNVPLIVTGSSSYHLKAKTRESLAGRATRLHVSPFSFSELLPPKKTMADPVWISMARDVIDQQLRFGSYPDVWLSNNKEDTLFDLIEAFVIRDASDLFKIKNISAFRQCLKLISWQIGDLTNFSEWGSIAGIDYNTVKNYIDILEESHIVKTVSPFVGGKRAEITSSPIVYFCDVGLRNAFSGQLTPLDERADRGRVFENWAFSELTKLLGDKHPIRFWRSKSGSESDFVVLTEEGLIGIEVKCSMMKRGKITRSSRSFIEAYHPKIFYVINRGYEGESFINSTCVRHILPESIGQIGLMVSS